MKKNVTILVLAVFIGVNLVLNIFNMKDKKIGYVNSHQLIYEFDGMKEMQLKFQAISQEWQANLDTLKLEYQKSLVSYQQIAEQLTEQERTERENLLRVQQNNVLQYAENIKQQSKDQEQKMLKAVLDQVNSLVEDYGSRKKYDLIFGTTESGNLLYGDVAVDITQEVIDEINENYEGL